MSLDIETELLTKFLNLDSVSGGEKIFSRALQEEFKKYADEIVYDNLGSVYAVIKSKKPNAKRVMITGHMDEVGFIVKGFNDNGTVSALKLGEISPNCLLGANVRVKLRNDAVINGTILGYDQKDEALLNKEDVLLDLGFADKSQIEDSGLHLGDRVSFANQSFSSLNGQRIFAKNWNGRYAPLLEIAFLKALTTKRFDFDLYVGCTVQEQVGYRGVQTATNLVKPDLGLVLDTDQAFDYQEKVSDKIGVLGQGLLINFYDKTVLPNRLLISTLKQLCSDEKIPYQYYYSMGGSDAAWINKLRTGSPTLFINIPVRNMNTPNSVIDVNDFNAAQTALVKFIEQLDNSKIQAFKEENR